MVGAALGILSIVGPGCAGSRARIETGDRYAIGLDEGGWRRVEPDRAYSPETLYEEIDGEAELFLPFGFRDLRVSIVAPAERPGAQVRIERFRHATARDAFGIFSQHRFPGQENATVGAAEAIVSESSLDFFRGASFVRIRASSRETTRSDLLLLGRHVFGLLDGEAKPPPETDAILLKGVDPRSIVYHKRAILGYEALAPGYEAKFADGRPPHTLILLPPDPASATARPVESVTKRLNAHSAPGSRLYRATLSAGTLWLARSGEYYCGISGKMTEEEALLIIREMETRLAQAVPAGTQ